MGFFGKRGEELPLERSGWDGPNGNGCIVSDRIAREGFKVGYFYREAPAEGWPDSGWRFLAGNEDDAYMSDPRNHRVFAIQTVRDYDRDIIPYLRAEVGIAFIRTGRDTIEADDGSKPIFLARRER